MPKRLSENISSQYVEAANKMKPKTSRRRIIAYVEAYDDIYFWRTVLGKYEDDTRYFEVMLPTRVGKLERGKKAALMNLLSSRVGSDMIACVDADYDYLEQGATQTSKTIIESPYIFHTYAYAIENLQCYAPSLHEVCVAVTLNDHALFDFEEFLSQFSEAIFPLFVWNIMYYRTPDYGEFTITKFLRIIETGNFTIERAADAIRNVKRKVHSKISQLQRDNPDAKDRYLAVKADLLELGVTPETTYLYIQGHHLFEKLVFPMLKRICDQLIKQREREISKQSVHSTQRHNELSCYRRSIGDLEMTLRRNLGYLRSEPFRRIRKDIEAFLK